MISSPFPEIPSSMNKNYIDLTIPISIGTVGGLTILHPLVKWSLELLKNVKKFNKKVDSLLFLRQQVDKERASENYYSLSDFISPNKADKDIIGSFVVTAGYDVDKYASTFEAKGDDYSSILIKSIV